MPFPPRCARDVFSFRGSGAHHWANLSRFWGDTKPPVVGLGKKRGSLCLPGRALPAPPPLWKECRAINNPPSAPSAFPRGSASAQTPPQLLALPFGPARVFIARGSSLPAPRGREDSARVCVFGSGAAVGKRPKWPLEQRPRAFPAPVSEGKPAPGKDLCCTTPAPGEGSVLCPPDPRNRWPLIPPCPWSGSWPCLSSLPPRDKD